MARSLADIVGENKKGLVKGPGGVLSEEEDLQGLVGKAGLPAAPTTAIGGAMLGATPDQQKMMGGPAQVQNALRMSLEGAETLEGARRLRQARTATAEEQKKMQKEEALQGLTSAEKTTQNLIQREMDKLAKEQAPTAEQLVVKAPPAGLSVAPEAFTSIRPQIVSALNDIRAGKLVPAQTIAAINTSLGRPITDLVDENFLNQFLVNSKEQIKQQGADAVRNNLTVKDLIGEPSFGYTTEQLSELLGVDPATLEATTVGDLDLLIKNAQTQQYSTVAQTREAVQSGLLGQAERQAARQTVREASEIGIAATEEDFQRLDDAVERADVITFAGKQMTVGDALKDENISQYISDYIDATPERKKEMEAEEPSITAFVKNNQAVFTAASEGLKKATTEFKGLQQENVNYSKNFPPELLKSVFKDWDKPSAVKLKDQNVSLFKYFNGLGPDQQKTVSANLQRVVGANPWLAEELSSLSPDELKRLNLDKSGTTLLDTYVAGRKRYDEIQNMDPDNVDAIVQQLAGGDTAVGAADIQQMLNLSSQLSLLGYPKAQLAAFDANNDGKLDDPATLLSTLKKNTTSAKLGEYLSNPKKISFPSFSTSMAEPTATARLLLDNLGPELSDGKLTEQEIAKSKGLDLDEISQIISSKDWASLPVSVRAGLTSRANTLRSDKFSTDMMNTARTLGKDYMSLVSDKVFLHQINHPAKYVPDLGALNDQVLAEHSAKIANLTTAIDALLRSQEVLDFPTVDMNQLRTWSEGLNRMVKLNEEEVASRGRRAKEVATAATQQKAQTVAGQFSAAINRQNKIDEATRLARGKRDLSGRLYRTDPVTGRHSVFNEDTLSWEE